MIVGLFLRNYKCYGNINFIPFMEDTNERLNVFIGENGIGKSSILESLDCLLNEIEPRTWETTIGQKKDRTFICPVFLIKRSEFQPTNEQMAISDSFWNNDFKSLNNSESTQSFSSWRDGLKDKINHNDYLLYCIGRNSSNDIIFTTTFHKKIFDQTKRCGVSKTKISDLFKKIISRYTYIYIPIENKISDILSLQANEMQGLMDKSVTSEIIALLSNKAYKNDDASKKNNSIVDLINENLERYIEEINSKVSQGYKFEARGTNKKTVKPNDILQAILKEYFSIRPLTKDGKNIKSLSSGQQRLALMDIASTLLSSNDEKHKKIILAIDEPESSLESSNRFEQFSRLVEISEKYGHQIFLTTHWYGLLLRPSTGRLNFTSDNPIAPLIKSYSLKNLYDNRRSFPDSIEMKSYFDLMSSMLSLIKKSNNNWLICEGYEDAMYLNVHMKHHLQNTHILPFNGCGNVKKLYQFLSVPFSDRNEQSQIKGKIFCLIDTDEKSLITIPGYKRNTFGGKLRFERLSLDRENNIAKTISVADTNATNTEIEDILNPKVMWAALKDLSTKDLKLKGYLDELKFNEESEYTDLTKDAKFLKKETVTAYKSFDEFKTYISSERIKQSLASHYCDNIGDYKNQPLPWMTDIIDYFKD